MNVRVYTAGPFAENTYLAWLDGAQACILIDPGAGASQALADIAAEDLKLEAVLLTHAHLDHVDGLPATRAAYPDVPIHLHSADRPLYDAAPLQAERFGMSLEALPTDVLELTVGQPLEVAGMTFAVRHAPGHAPGHVVFWSEPDGLTFAGDVIFAGSIGRTDLPGGDFRTLMASIRREILTLPDDTRLLTGHGPETTVGFERGGNPFLTPQYLGDFV
jgi:hydroxyacylglutathione hydrolase